MAKTGRVQISRVGVWSLAKVEGILLALFGLIQAIALSFFGVTNSMMGMMGVSGFATFGLVGFPILYGLVGFLSGAATAIIYNFIVKLIGGIELELE